MKPLAKVLFIAFDALDKDLVERWSYEGLMPTFKELYEKSAWGLTTTPLGFYVGSIWPSFATSLAPGHHDCYCYTQIKNGTYWIQPYSVFDFNKTLFWETISQANRRVAVIDVPRIPPTENLNGIHIVDWGTHDPDLPDKLYTWPHELAQEIEANYGRDPIGQCNNFPRTVEGFKHFRSDLITRAEKKTALSLQFLKEGNWDLFMTVFAESHCVGHQCWHLNDPNHPKYTLELAEQVGNPMQDVYIALDKALKKILDQVDPETTVFVMASHGMGPHYDGTFLLEDILIRLDQLETPFVKQQIVNVLNTDRSPGLKKFLHPLKKIFWQPIRKRFWQTDKAFRNALSEPDLAQRSCFTVPNNDVYGAIRINLKGREPQGKIEPGAACEAFCDQLIKDLLEVKNIYNDAPLVKQVYRTGDFYEGQHLTDLPDLLVEWHREWPVTGAESPRIGRIEKHYSRVRTGDHKPHGLFFAYGPSIRPGQLERPVSVMDFAPTIASLLEVSLPGVDGHPISELLPQPSPFPVQGDG